MPIKLQRIKNYLPRAFSAASTNSGFALALFFIRLAIFDISFSISRSKTDLQNRIIEIYGNYKYKMTINQNLEIF